MIIQLLPRTMLIRNANYVQFEVSTQSRVLGRYSGRLPINLHSLIMPLPYGRFENKKVRRLAI